MKKEQSSQQCSSIKPDGSRCLAWSMNESEFCFTHNPKTKKQKRSAVIKGGRGNKKEIYNLEPIEVKSQKDTPKLILKIMNELRLGLIDVRVANCLFYGSNQLIKALEISDLEQKVEKLDNNIQEIINKVYGDKSKK